MPDVVRTLNKVLEEISIGNPQEAENLLSSAIPDVVAERAEMTAALYLHHAAHVAFEHGNDEESERQYAKAVDATRVILAKVRGDAA
jgi:hypothetical protein